MIMTFFGTVISRLLNTGNTRRATV